LPTKRGGRNEQRGYCREPRFGWVGPGTGRHTWLVSSEHVDLAPQEAAPRKVTIQADPQNITLDLARTAIIVVDMQNDFCAPGGWVDNLGADLTP
jgi:hypothetical protein